MVGMMAMAPRFTPGKQKSLHAGEAAVASRRGSSSRFTPGKQHRMPGGEEAIGHIAKSTASPHPSSTYHGYKDHQHITHGDCGRHRLGSAWERWVESNRGWM